MGTCLTRSYETSFFEKEIFIAEGVGGKISYIELGSMKKAILDQDKEYNKKWAKLDESVNESSTLWLDLVAEDHSKLAETVSLYVLPNLYKINLTNVFANKVAFQKFLINSIPQRLQELQISSHDFEVKNMGSSHKLILQAAKSVSKRLHLGSFALSMSQFK